MLRECVSFVFFFKQKTAYVLRISDGNSDVCSSDLQPLLGRVPQRVEARDQRQRLEAGDGAFIAQLAADLAAAVLRLVEQGADRRDGRILKAGDRMGLAAEGVAAAVPEELADEIAAAKVGVGQRQCDPFSRSEEQTSKLPSLIRKS